MALAYFVLVGVGQVAGLVSRARLDRTLDNEERNVLPAHTSAAALQLGLLNQRAGVLGYALTGDERFLAAYERGRLDQGAAFDVLRRSLADAPGLLGASDDLERAIETWRLEVAAPAALAVQQGRGAEAAALLAERGESLFGPVRAGSGELVSAIDEAMRRDQRRVDEAESQLAALMLLGSTTGFVLSVATILLVRRWVIRPITQLSVNVRRVADGDLEHGITPSGPPELAGLGRDVEAMRQRILSELDNAVRAVEALEQAAPLVVRLRSELAGGRGCVPRGLTVASRFHPAEGVLAGDWYDLIELDRDRVALAVVDISGHGAPAGLLALKIKQLLVAALRLEMRPGEALGWVASQLGDTGDQFATCLVAEVSVSSGVCRYANAGHPPGLVFGRSYCKELPLSGPLLGPLDATWTTRTTNLDPHDLLVVYTDGLVEARDATGKEFGIDRLIERVAARRDRSPENVADDVIRAVRRFSDSRLVDDVTLVVMARGPSPALVRARR